MTREGLRNAVRRGAHAEGRGEGAEAGAYRVSRKTSELRKMGAEVVTTGTTTAIISGPTPLAGASVKALDIRAGAALILAGLAASGRTEITDIYHVDRGYERIDERLRSLGAVIERA